MARGVPQHSLFALSILYVAISDRWISERLHIFQRLSRRSDRTTPVSVLEGMQKDTVCATQRGRSH